MEKILNVYKPIGLTPLDIVKKIKEHHPEFENIKIGYAGRLDPMAEGLLLLLVGEENKKKHEYEKLDKEYEFDVLFGFSTDTYDLLGLVKNVSTQPTKEEIKDLIENRLLSFVGKKEQDYPPFSAGRYRGKPLFYWAKKGEIENIKLPTKVVNIYNLKFISRSDISRKDLETTIKERINLVSGDFRQAEILECWKNTLSSLKEDNFKVLRFKAKVSSGVYIRALAMEMGKSMGQETLAFSIKRTSLDKYSIKDSINI